MPEGDAASAARQELAEDRDDLGREIANVRENLDEAIRGTRAELCRRLGPPSATLIGGFAVSLPIAPDRVAAEMRAAGEAARSLEGGALSRGWDRRDRLNPVHHGNDAFTVQGPWGPWTSIEEDSPSALMKSCDGRIRSKTLSANREPAAFLGGGFSDGP